MVEIPITEIQYSNLSLVDDVGRVFSWRGAIYRAIPQESEAAVLRLFESGLIDRLHKERVIPQTRVSEHSLVGYRLVLRHETVPYVTYPHEWSFSMFRDAALLVLRIVEIAATFGYGLKDSHPYNVLFFGTQPVFVDIGSLVFQDDHIPRIPGDFASTYFYPLSIWSSGDPFLARRIISSGHDCMPSASWHLYRNGGCVPPPKKTAARIVQGIQRRIWKYLPAISPSNSSVTPPLLKWRESIDLLESPKNATRWDAYHDEYFLDAQIQSTPRFDRLLDIVRSLQCTTAVELAGNQGLFSLLLLEKAGIKRVVCSDYDAAAIDKLYVHADRSNSDIVRSAVFPAVVNFIIPEMNYFTASPSIRFQSDLVLALAVMHHLILTQGFRLKDIIQRIAEYTNEYAIVEFMPLGLWDGNYAPPVPAWYNEEWFCDGFSEHFEVIRRDEVETNRIAFVGKKRAKS